jgi:hypothetical protein
MAGQLLAGLEVRPEKFFWKKFSSGQLIGGGERRGNHDGVKDRRVGGLDAEDLGRAGFCRFTPAYPG